MSKVKIIYYGHSCFKVEALSGSIIFDPYADGSVPGLRLPHGLKADVVSCSHQHDDHNAAELVRTTGDRPMFTVQKLTVPHDHHDGDPQASAVIGMREDARSNAQGYGRARYDKGPQGSVEIAVDPRPIADNKPLVIL